MTTHPTRGGELLITCRPRTDGVTGYSIAIEDQPAFAQVAFLHGSWHLDYDPGPTHFASLRLAVDAALVLNAMSYLGR